MKLFDLFPPLLDLESGDSTPGRIVSALHSGNIGDVIYSLPTAFALGATHFLLNVCSDPGFGARVMTRESALKLAPLLLGQGTIRRVTVIQSQIPLEYAEPARIGVDYVLDTFRTSTVEPQFHLTHRHALPFGIQVDGAKRWLESEGPRDGDLPEGIGERYLVIGLTSRYRRWGDDYYASLLRDVPPDQIVFVGVEADLVHKTDIGGAYLKADDFGHLARVIAGASLFIGNPSFPYALAEGLKVPRLVELAEGINVAPLDPGGLALHLHSEGSLRARIFEAIGCRAPELGILLDRIEELSDRLEPYEAEKKARDEAISLLRNSNRVRPELLPSLDSSIQSFAFECAKTLDRTAAERDDLADQVRQLKANIGQLHANLESTPTLIKNLIRQTMRSNRLTASLHVSLSRIAPLRRLWRSLDLI